ncbi:MAG: hypothetical protein ACFBSC_21350 [Microcoleaceae cyanobacterium]
MQIAPLQLVVVGFDNDQNFRGQIKRELGALRSRGTIRLLDLLFVQKDTDSNAKVMFEDQPDDPDFAEYGTALRQLLDLEIPAEAIAEAANLNGSGKVYGVTPAEIQAIIDQVEPGQAVGLVLFEHTWAAGLSAAIRDAGGHLVAQGILTRDTVMILGSELAALAEAEMMIEATEAIKGAAVLDAISFAGATEKIEQVLADDAATSMIAAETLRTLIASEVVSDSEIEPALVALIGAGLLSPEILETALTEAEAAISAIDELITAQESAVQ